MRGCFALLFALCAEAAAAEGEPQHGGVAVAHVPSRDSGTPTSQLLQKNLSKIGAANVHGRTLELSYAERVAAHEHEIEESSIRSTVAHNDVLRNTLDREHRAPWFNKVLSVAGMNDLVDSSLCFLLNWACPEPPAFIDSEWGTFYFWCLVLANTFVLLLVISVLGGAMHRCCDPMPRVLRNKEATLTKQPLTVLLPCYLPNEHEIMDDTIEHIIHKVEYEYPFTLIVCYNTPRPMAAEEQLSYRDGTVYPNGRRLQVLKVNDSTSKAENLNAALDYVTTENVVIYDADHHPDPRSLLIAMAAMDAHGVQCVQGSTYLRTRPNMLAQYINAEFFVTHFVWFPAMQFITTMGVFGGSNALWRTDALKRYQFRPDVQTEDIDLSTRALLGGRVRIRFEPRCRSGELPPASFRALYRQRLRWALGWDQVTLQHMSSIGHSPLGCLQKFGLYYILPLRWGVLLSATLNALLTPLIAYWYFHTTGGKMGQPIETCILLSLLAFCVCCVVVAINAITYEPVRRWPAVLLFQLSGVLYIGWQILLVTVSLAKICTGSDGGWVVTRRLGARPAHEGPTRPPECTPIAAAFAQVRRDEEADRKVPGSLRASSPTPYRPPRPAHVRPAHTTGGVPGVRNHFWKVGGTGPGSLYMA